MAETVEFSTIDIPLNLNHFKLPANGALLWDSNSQTFIDTGNGPKLPIQVLDQYKDIYASACLTKPNLLDKDEVYQKTQEFHKHGRVSLSPEQLKKVVAYSWHTSGRCLARGLSKPEQANNHGIEVMDFRQVNEPNDIVLKIEQYLDSAFREGKLNPTMAVFPQAYPGYKPPRIVNNQIIGYWNDHRNQDIVKLLQGIHSSRDSDNPYLPIIIQDSDGSYHVYEKSKEFFDQYQVSIEITDESEYVQYQEAFNRLGLKYPAIPAISNMELHWGNIAVFPNVVFNGYFVEFEILQTLIRETIINGTEFHKILADVFKIQFKGGTNPNWHMEVENIFLNIVVQSYRDQGITILSTNEANKLLEAGLKTDTNYVRSWVTAHSTHANRAFYSRLNASVDIMLPQLWNREFDFQY